MAMSSEVSLNLQRKKGHQDKYKLKQFTTTRPCRRLLKDPKHRGGKCHKSTGENTFHEKNKYTKEKS